MGEYSHLRAVLCAAALALVDAIDGKPDIPRPLRVRLERGGCRHEYTVHPNGAPPPPLADDDAGALRRAFFTSTERKIVRTLSETPLKQDAVVTALDGECSPTNVRAALAALVERGVLVLTRAGYAVADTLFSALARDFG